MTAIKEHEYGTELQLVTVKEAAKRLSLAPSKVYELCYMGQLRSNKIGKAVRIPVKAIEEFIEHTSRDNSAA